MSKKDLDKMKISERYIRKAENIMLTTPSKHHKRVCYGKLRWVIATKLARIQCYIIYLTGLPAVVQEVHEESEVLEEQLTLGLHQVSPVGLLALEREPLQEGGHRVHAGLVQIPGYSGHVPGSGRRDLKYFYRL